MREEIIGDARLILGDCKHILENVELGTIDAIVTDPPYGIDKNGVGYGRGHRAIAQDTNTDSMRIGVGLAWGLVVQGIGAVFYSARNTPDAMNALPTENYLGEIIWDKKAPGLGNPLRYQHENIALFSKGGGHPSRPVIYSALPLQGGRGSPPRKASEANAKHC